jgi:hypothetical protein
LGLDIFSCSIFGAIPDVQLVSGADDGIFLSSGNGRSTLIDNYGFFSLHQPSLGLDGRYVAFFGEASDLVPNDTNGVRDVFVRDVITGSTICPSFALSNSPVWGFSMSANGRWIAYGKSDSLQSPHNRQLYVYDIVSRTNFTIVPPNAMPGDNNLALSFGFGFTADSRFLIFGYTSLNNPALWGYYVYDFIERRIYSTGQRYLHGLTAGGRYLFQETTILTNGARKAATRLYDWWNQTTNNALGIPVASSFQDEIMLFGEGRRFESSFGKLYINSFDFNPSNLVATNVVFPTVSGDGSIVVFGQGERTMIYDVGSGLTAPIQDEAGANLSVRGPISISPDGRFIAIAGRKNPEQPTMIFVYDRVLKNLTLVSHNTNGLPAELSATSPFISADGRTVVFDSVASDLVPNDRNLNHDVFVARLTPQDSDNDGMEDGWEVLNFGNLSGDPAADLDADGLTGLEEAQIGSNPKDSASGLPRVSLNKVGEQWMISFNAILWKSYRVQSRPSLASGDWQDIAVATAFSDRVEVPATGTTGSPMFYRVEVVTE